jgi:hypothetical protein
VGTAGYSEILRQLGTFFELCDSACLRPEAEGGRFGIYENRIRRLVGHIEAIDRGEPEAPLFAEMARDLPVYLVALAECQEVGEMTPFLKTCPQDLLASRLKAVVRGPVLPSDENQSSNQARISSLSCTWPRFSPGSVSWRASRSRTSAAR